MQFKVIWALLLGIGIMPSGWVRADSSSSEDIAERYVQLANRQKELIHQRIKIAEKWRDWRYTKAKDDYTMGYTPLSRIDAEIDSYLKEIQRLDIEVARVQASRADLEKMAYWTRDFAKQQDLAKEQCLFDECKKTLSPFAKIQTLQSDLIQIESKLLRDELLKEAQEDSSQNSAGNSNLFSLAHSILSLQEKRFDCERTLMRLQYNSVIQAEPMAECLESIIARNEPIRPTFPKDEKWPNVIDNAMSIHSPTHSVKDLLTGEESSLEAWALKQQPASIHPWEFFEKAYVLSQGNLYKALRTAYNVLRLNRTRPPFQRNLMDIRGDRPKLGDNSGDWYHFFGTMLAWRTTGYITYAGAALYRVFEGEEWLKELSGPGHDPKEEGIDFAGIRAMQLLNDRLEGRYLVQKKGKKPTPSDPSRACRVERVLRFTP